MTPRPATQLTPADLDRVLARAKESDALGRKIAAALALIEGVMDDLGEDAVALSFNGGKDCTVLLHLFATVLYERHNALPSSLKPAHAALSLSATRTLTPTRPPASAPAPAPRAPECYLDAPAAAPPPLPCSLRATDTYPTATHHTPTPVDPAPAHTAPFPLIRSVYFTAPNPFPALEAFVIQSASAYAMDLYRFGGGMKAALGEYLACRGGKEISAILLGTRTGDPNGDVAVLAPTDASWPQVLRVHPVLDWTYAEIWDFLRQLDVSYCRLYDDGYTSLGSTNNTERNPLLRTESGWAPAYMLSDPSQERAGRVKRPA